MLFKVTHLGLGLGYTFGAGGWVLLGPMGLVVPVSAPGAVRPSKEACGGAARAAENHFATLPTYVATGATPIYEASGRSLRSTPWANAAGGVRAGSSRCACPGQVPGSGALIGALRPWARTDARPLWGTGVVPVTPWPGRRPPRPRTALRYGGPPGRAAVCTRVSSGQRPMREPNPTCAIVQPAVSLRPPCRGHYTY